MSDVIPLIATGLATASLAFYLRIFIHFGKTPSGVDTWYFLAYARAFRHSWRMPVRLNTYLLQDEEQSYPPLFPSFLALLPTAWLERGYWLVSPLVDCFHLLILHGVAYKISGSVLAATVSSLIYAVTPQLVSETRSLNSRAFGAVIQSLAMLALFRYVVGGDIWPWLPLAVLLAAAVFLAHSLTAISFGVANFTLALVLGDWRFLAIVAIAPIFAYVLTGSLYARGVLGHIQSARFWRKRKLRRQVHQVLDSPIYGDAEGVTAAPQPRRNAAHSVAARLIGENPFILSVIAAIAVGFLPLYASDWAKLMFWWASGVFVWAFLTTFVGPLRVFGPGYLYIKTSTFPTAYTLGALVLGSGLSQTRPLLVLAILLPAFAASAVALWYFYRYIRGRTAEHTATAPPALQSTARFLTALPGGRFACLPTMYADYLAFKSGKQVLWGGHSGDPERLAGFYPVISRPLESFFAEHRIDYFVVERAYVEPERLKLAEYVTLLRDEDGFLVYAVSMPTAA